MQEHRYKFDTNCGNNFLNKLIDLLMASWRVCLTWLDSNTGEIIGHNGDDDNSSDDSDQTTVMVLIKCRQRAKLNENPDSEIMAMDLHALNDRYGYEDLYCY